MARKLGLAETVWGGEELFSLSMYFWSLSPPSGLSTWSLEHSPTSHVAAQGAQRLELLGFLKAQNRHGVTSSVYCWLEQDTGAAWIEGEEIRGDVKDGGSGSSAHQCHPLPQVLRWQTSLLQQGK